MGEHPGTCSNCNLQFCSVCWDRINVHVCDYYGFTHTHTHTHPYAHTHTGGEVCYGCSRHGCPCEDEVVVLLCFFVFIFSLGWGWWRWRGHLSLFFFLFWIFFLGGFLLRCWRSSFHGWWILRESERSSVMHGLRTLRPRGRGLSLILLFSIYLCSIDLWDVRTSLG